MHKSTSYKTLAGIYLCCHVKKKKKKKKKKSSYAPVSSRVSGIMSCKLKEYCTTPFWLSSMLVT